MTTPSAPGLAEVESLLRAKDGPQYEYVDGKLEQRNVSIDSSEVASWITALLVLYVRDRRLGRVFDSELGIRIFADPNRTRRADVSFVRAQHAPRADSGFLRVPPDLVVEVVSPGDSFQEIRSKVSEWIANGVSLVWVVDPSAREVHVFRSSGGASILAAEEQISGEDVLPGFAVTVRDLFPA